MHQDKLISESSQRCTCETDLFRLCMFTVSLGIFTFFAQKECKVCAWHLFGEFGEGCSRGVMGLISRRMLQNKVIWAKNNICLSRLFSVTLFDVCFHSNHLTLELNAYSDLKKTGIWLGAAKEQIYYV